MDLVKKREILCLVTILVFITGSALCEIHEYAGTSGAQFLKFGPGARQAAMGDAFSSVSGDAFTLCWNPALISEIDKNVFSFMHSFWLENVSIDYAAVVVPTSTGNLGISFGYLNAGTIEKIDKTGTVLSGGFTPYDIILGVSFARNIISSLNAGCTLKGIYSDIDSIAAFSYALDAGATYGLLQDTLKVGVSLQNLGSSMKFVSQQDPLPFTIRAGASYRFKLLLVSLDTVIPNDANLSIHFGAEYGLKIAESIDGLLRVGYNTKNSSAGGISGLSLGAGIQTESYAVDYAWVPFGILGSTHRLSMNLKFK